jgi:pimeloyl-ACP methyl ester carboxylesterase
MNKYFLLIVLFTFTSILNAKESARGHVVLKSGERIFVDYKAPRSSEHPVFVLVNGLIYETERWGAMAQQLSASGAGVLRYDFKGQHRTYVYAMEDNDGRPEYFEKGIKLSENAKDLKELLSILEINQRVQIVGLSYGASIAAEFARQFPSSVDNLIFMSPLVISLDKYDPQGLMLRNYLDSMNWWGPFGWYWSNYYYDQIYRSYFDQTPSSRNHHYGKYEEAFRESVFQQVKAVKDFDLRYYDYSRIFKDNQKVHLMVADKEEKKYLKDMLEVWKRTKNKGSLTYYENTYHAIPDTNPYVSGIVLLNIAGKNPDFHDGSASHLRRERTGIVKEPIEDISVLLK